ncbi:TcfC E-set like domain-containing protein [Citrobacter portucalensis]|uniref:TcfC E-set like domain-containing protein n=1 Tax=Citrobacter portucalensis TaxID=1639133 RepID=UPI003BF4B990
MKKYLLIFTLLPVSTTSANMSLAENIRGLPEDFRRYFYNAEVIVQVYLNDHRLFDAAVYITENSHVKLLYTFDDNTEMDIEHREIWSTILQRGISLGQCTIQCPSGLMAAEYRLNSSALKLYTAQYETQRSKSEYINLSSQTPTGLVMYNDLTTTYTPSIRSWGLNSSLTSSLAGWSQRVSFQSSGTEGDYSYVSSSVYELFAQKEQRGSFTRLGFFTPASDRGSVQMSGFDYDTIAGVMWGTSDALLDNFDNVSAWPVYVTGHNQSIAEIWRDGRLIHTQQLQSGVQPLDTRQLPGGIYDITINIIANGQIVDTQHTQIYKPQGWRNLNKRWRMNIWAGQQTSIPFGEKRNYENRPFATGGGVDLLVHPRAALGLSGTLAENEYQVRTQGSLTLSPDDTLFAQYAQRNSDSQSHQEMDIRYYRNISGGSSASLFWHETTAGICCNKTLTPKRSDIWGSTLSLRLPHTTSLILNTHWMDTPWRQGLGTDISITTVALFYSREINVRMSAFDRPGNKDSSRDRGIAFGVSLSLSPAANHIFSAETGVNQNQGYSSLNYQMRRDNSSIDTLGMGISYSPQNTVISGNASFDTPHIGGDGYWQHNTHDQVNIFGGNLNQLLVIGGGEIASVSGNSSRSVESAIIVDIDADNNTENIIASGDMTERRLYPGRNIVPAELWRKSSIQFSTSNGDSVMVYPQRQNFQMSRGSVEYMKVKAVRTYTLIGRLYNEQGEMLKNRYVNSEISSGLINPEGVLTIDVAASEKRLTINAGNTQPAVQCDLPSTMIGDKKVYFIPEIHCRNKESGAFKR